MKWICLSSLFLFFSVGVLAQQPQPVREPAYKANPFLPPLEVLRPDSSIITRNDLKKQETLIMYFSPDCDHCIKQMEEMDKRAKDLKKLQIIMVTHQPMPMLVDFIKKYNLKSQPNFLVGRDAKFILPGYYQMKSLPYFALYDKEGKFIAVYESNTKVDTLLKAFEKK